MAKIQGNKKACLITPGHIAADPRLVKEAQALSRAGMQVHLIFTQYVDYLIAHDKMILDANPGWTAQYLNWSGGSFFSKVVRVVGGLMRFTQNNNTKINRNYLWQLNKAIAYPADIYIAHNPGAVSIAVTAAKKNKAKCGFDAEDFHRNERSDDENDEDVKLKTAIENATIHQFDYMVAASPQIAAKYEELFNRIVTPVLNVFPKTHINTIINNTDKPLQLFWFSQTIGRNRGLEMVIDAINLSGIVMELHLLGKVDISYKDKLLALNDKHQHPYAVIHFHSPVPGDELFNITAKYDIGIASEPGFSTNNKIALSNKLFTYIQCGLAVVASNTTAQAWFMEQYPETGKLYGDEDELAAILTAYHSNRDLLYETKKSSYAIGQTKLNWEIESDKLITVVQQTLANQ